MNTLIRKVFPEIITAIAVLSLSLSSAGIVAAQDASRNRDEKVNAKPGDEVDSEKVDKGLLSDLVIKYTNEQRREAGLEPLSQDDTLEELATSHSLHMAKRDYFSHTTERRTGEDIPFSERVSAQELGFRRTAENLALQPVVLSKRITTRTAPSGETTREVERDKATYDKVARSTVDGWMKSPGHRENILTPELNRVGIGVGQGERDGTPYLWITQNFGQK